MWATGRQRARIWSGRWWHRRSFGSLIDLALRGCAMWCGSPEHRLHRRAFLQGALGGLTAALNFGGVGVSAGEPAAAALRKHGRQVIFVWLAGGSSQFET